MNFNFFLHIYIYIYKTSSFLFERLVLNMPDRGAFANRTAHARPSKLPVTVRALQPAGRQFFYRPFSTNPPALS